MTQAGLPQKAHRLTKRDTKKLLVAAAIGSLIAIIAVVVWSVFLMPPNKQDFAQAKVTAEKIATYKGTALLRKFSDKVGVQYRAGDRQQKLIVATESEKQAVLDAMQARGALANELKDSRITRDKEVRKAFDAYYARENRYARYISDYAAAFPVYMSSFGTCIEVFEINDKAGDNLTLLAGLHRTAAKPCLQDLETLRKTPITPLAEYATEFARIVRERQKVFDGIEAKTLDETEAGKRIKRLGNEYSKNDRTEDLRAYGEAAVFNGELTALTDLLAKKAEPGR